MRRKKKNTIKQRLAKLSPFHKTANKANKALSDAEKFIANSDKIVKIGAVIFVSAMGLSILSSAISIKVAVTALRKY